MVAKLGISEEGMKNSEVGMFELTKAGRRQSRCGKNQRGGDTYALALFAQVAELPNENVDEDAKVVGIKVLLSARSREEQV